MMKIRYSILLIFLLHVMTFVQAETPAAVSTCVFGHVVDNQTQEHLSDINISIKGTTFETRTDAAGHFTFEDIPVGNLTLQFRAVGYKTQNQTVTTFKNQTSEMHVAMEPTLIPLDEIVVSSNRNETTKRLAPTLVHTLDHQVFENSHAVCLAQGLNYQSGLRVENDCHTCGTEQVRMNGLEGSYTQILIDSRPVFSALAGVYGLEQIPESMIDRVEIVKGGGSALFGSSSIAGTINIITKKPEGNSAQLSHDLTFIGGSSAVENTTGLNVSMVNPNQKTGLVLFAQSRYRDGYDYDGDGYTDLPEMRSQTIGMRSFFKTSNYSKLSLEYHSINDYRRGGDSLNLQPDQATVAEEAEHTINGGGVNFDIFSPDNKTQINLYASAQSIQRKSYSGADQDPNGYGHTDDLTYLAGGQYTYSWDKCLFLPAQFTGGVEYNYDDLKDQILGYGRDIRQKVHTESLFLQNEWKNDLFSFLLGGRFDKHSMIDHVIFSPRATFRYNPVQDLHFRMSYSTGFRAPQIYDEDLHASAVSGQVVLITSAKNLQEEKSQSLSASMDWYYSLGKFPSNLTLEGFYTNLDHVFVLEDVGTDEQGNILKERTNGSGASVKGLTLEDKIAFSSQLNLQAGLTWQKSQYKEAENWSDSEDLSTRKMMRTPDLYGYFTANLIPARNFQTSLSGTYTGSMLVPHAAGYIEKDINVTTPDFLDMTVKFGYTIPIEKSVRIQINAGVQNLFDAYQSDADKGKNRDSDYVYGPSMCRSFFVGTKISL
jgi:outer membrane receptor for ferrienterochelin and colicins